MAGNRLHSGCGGRASLRGLEDRQVRHRAHGDRFVDRLGHLRWVDFVWGLGHFPNLETRWLTCLPLSHSHGSRRAERKA